MDIAVPISNDYFTTYTVNSGDNLYAIARRYNINPTLLAALNGLNMDDYIYPNQKIMIPKSGYSFYITKDGDTWVVTGKEIERLFNMTKFTEEQGVLRFGRILRAMGVEETLEKMGAKPGDDVAINDYLFTYKG